MKDNRFIDLLNLYIDRQISVEETAELEAEIQENPKRQAVYRQYCQIHSATKVVYESFRAGAADQPSALSGRPATVELFENRRRTNWVYYAGGLTVAACLALVFVRNNQSVPLATPAAVAAVKVQPATMAVVYPAPVAVAQAPVVPAAEIKPGLINLRNSPTNPDYSTMLAALREQDEAAAAGERWQTARNQSLFEDNLFESKQSLVTTPEQRTLRRQTAEFTAFQFQR